MYRVFDNGYFYTVTVSAQHVADFADTWPCSGLSYKAVTFQFKKSNGDLVDTNNQVNHPNADGDVMTALADDAMHVGASRLGLLLNR